MLRAGACTLAFAGEGAKARPYCEKFRRLAGELPGVEMLGFIGREALAEEFGQSTLLVLPTFEDNCPMVGAGSDGGWFARGDITRGRRADTSPDLSPGVGRSEVRTLNYLVHGD